MSLLTPERHKRIVELLHEKKMVTVQDLVEETGASDSTIRRDLIVLEEANKLVRFHGGAELPRRNSEERTLSEKTGLNIEAKKSIAKHASTLE